MISGRYHYLSPLIGPGSAPNLALIRSPVLFCFPGTSNFPYYVTVFPFTVNNIESPKISLLRLNLPVIGKNGIYFIIKKRLK